MTDILYKQIEEAGLTMVLYGSNAAKNQFLKKSAVASGTVFLPVKKAKSSCGGKKCSQTRVSVIMPVFNTREDYLKAALRSVLEQTFPDFELLVVDNGSEKEIKDIILSFADERVKYYRLEQNQGPAAARNFAIEKAKGEFLAFMDSDDVSLPEKLEKQVRFLTQHPEIGCLGTKTRIIGDDCQNIKFPDVTTHQDIEKYLIFNGCAFCLSSVMLRQSLLIKNNLCYQDCFVPAEDYALWLDLVGKTKFAVLDEELVLYRFHAANVSHQKSLFQQEQCLRAQFAALQKISGVHQLDWSIWHHFLQGKLLSADDYVRLNDELIKVKDGLGAGGYINADETMLFQKKLKRPFYHTHSISGQWRLFRSPICKTLHVSFGWRLFCFITRGIL